MDLLNMTGIANRVDFVVWSKFVLVAAMMAWPAVLNATTNEPKSSTDIQSLLQIEQEIQEVVRRNMNIVVAVTDGIGYGSGVIVSEDGLVLTAGHVLTTGGSDLRVIFPDGREVEAEPLGRNLDVDAGMIKLVEPGPWEYAEKGDISELRKGDWCICLGHSGGYELGRKPPVRAGRIINFEQDSLLTDCVLIGGDSGGPLFDTRGRVIGIHSSIGASVAENRHVSIATFNKHWDRMIRGEKWGVLPELAHQQDPQQHQPAPSPRPKTSLGIRVDRSATNARILLVHPGGAAEAAGMLAGDVVIEFDGIAVSNSNNLIDLIQQRRAGDSVEIKLRRGNDEISVTVFLRAQAGSPAIIGGQVDPRQIPIEGTIVPGQILPGQSFSIPREGQILPNQGEIIVPRTPGRY